MRAEEILNESELFANKDECYIHCEKCAGGFYSSVMVGDPKTILEGIFVILKKLSESREISFRMLLKTLKRMNRHVETIEHNKGFWR